MIGLGNLRWWSAALAAGVIAPSQSASAEVGADPVATRAALSALFSAADAAIPKSSSCFGNYGQSGEPRVKDFLAMELAYLYAGRNVIEGACPARRCRISIRHAAGEDVSSAVIEFDVIDHRADVATLRCVITP